MALKATYSVIIPAYNEQHYLPATLDGLRTAMDAAGWIGEVIVVDNNSTDATADIAGARGARVIFEPVNQIARARNAGARCSTADFILFVDADTLVPPGLLHQALGGLAAGRWAGGGARICPDQPLKGLPALLVRLWNGFSQITRMAAGSFIFCRRDAFAAIGGFDQRLFAGEEIVFSQACRRWGRARGLCFDIIAAPPVVTSTRKLAHLGPTQLAVLALLALFPPAVFFRPLVQPFWYRRF